MRDKRIEFRSSKYYFDGRYAFAQFAIGACR